MKQFSIVYAAVFMVVAFATFAGAVQRVFAQSDSTAADTAIVIKAGDSGQLTIILAAIALLILMLVLAKSAFRRPEAPNIETHA